MSERLTRKADLLLLQSGYDKNGKKIKSKRYRRILLKKLTPKKEKKSKLAAKIISENKELIASRKKSDLSNGEQRIAEFLASEGIKFTREYYMKGLFNPKTNKPLFFDFYVPSYNLVIEFDGLHHFRNDANPTALKEQKQKDCIKNTFCERKKIYMLRIPVWKENRIEKLICERVDQIMSNK